MESGRVVVEKEEEGIGLGGLLGLSVSQILDP
jgi:hypothetical protein